jgi:methylated-DNA-[protein]-cysteine S-methyltransferase
MSITVLDTPVGPLTLFAMGGALTRIDFGATAEPSGPSETLERAIRELRDYFAGDRRTFDVPLAPSGTPFDLEVWEALRGIRHGETISYAELARRVGRPAAARAVGHANGRNPLPIVIPCHRVIASDGSLGGYAGGLPMKRALLDLEGAFDRERTAPPVSATVRGRARAR